jgi:hypothetical protein
VVTLYGQVVREVDNRIEFQIDAARGDAAAAGLSGMLRLGRHQSIGGVGELGKWDVVRLTDALAKAKAAEQVVPPTQGRRA